MYCGDLKSCLSEINAYCNGRPTGRSLLVNTENYDTFQQIRGTLEADKTKTCSYVSDFCPNTGLPNLEDVLNQVTGAGCHVIIGLSQAAMLRSADYMNQLMGTLLEKPVRGYLIVLLNHCEHYLKKYFSIHPDIQKRVVLSTDAASVLPRIRIAANAEECIGSTPIPNIRQLLVYLERLTDAAISANEEISVVTKFSLSLFSKALYSVAACDSLYDGLRKHYTEIAAGTEKTYGNDAQWKYLAAKLSALGTISAVAEDVFGSAINLQSYLGQVLAEEDENKTWLLWLAMKLYGAKGNKYLTHVLQNSVNVSDFEERVYLDLLDMKHSDASFHQCYTERKMLIDILPENLALLDKYCEKVGIYQKNAVYYLTDASEKEELAFMQ